MFELLPKNTITPINCYKNYVILKKKEDYTKVMGIMCGEIGAKMGEKDGILQVDNSYFFKKDTCKEIIFDVEVETIILYMMVRGYYNCEKKIVFIDFSRLNGCAFKFRYLYLKCILSVVDYLENVSVSDITNKLADAYTNLCLWNQEPESQIEGI